MRKPRPRKKASFLLERMEVDRLPDHVLLFAATNHEEMLDRAVSRHFDYCCHLPAPDRALQKAWLDLFASRHPKIPVADLVCLEPLEGLSFSLLEQAALKACRKHVLLAESKTT